MPMMCEGLMVETFGEQLDRAISVAGLPMPEGDGIVRPKPAGPPKIASRKLPED